MPPLARLLVLAAALTAIAAPAQAKTPPGQARKELREQLGRYGLVQLDRRTGTARAVGRLDGYLTGEESGAAKDVALGYLKTHGDALGLPAGVPPGLSLLHQDSAGGLRHLRWDQSYRGIPSSDTGLRATVTASGRLLSLGGSPAPDPSVASIEPKLPPQKAYAAVAGHAPRITARGSGPEQRAAFAGGGSASLVLYQGDQGTRLGWRVLAPVSAADFADATVDATDGTVVRRANRVKRATPQIYPGTPANSTQIAFPWPAEWLSSSATSLNGPFVHAIADEGDAVHFGALTVPAGAEIGDWDDAAGTRNQATTQLFYLANVFQQHLAAFPISFTTQNFKGADAVIAQARDGGIGANAQFTTLPDGRPGLMEVGMFGGKDGTNDPTIVYHEYTHGMTGRLVTDAQGFGATDSAQASAIDEGTSDFYALDFLNQTVMGSYVDPGIRSQPITGTHTYSDFGHVGGHPEPHADGEIWAQTLWAIRNAVGTEAARRIITQALRIVPPQPSFLDMRNAILEANTSSDTPLWAVFADRGMGYFASTDGSDDTQPVPDFTDPTGRTDFGVLQGTVRNEDGAPLAGAHVGVAGQDDGLGPVLADDTDGLGRYAITALKGTAFPLVVASKAAYGAARAEDVTLPSSRDFTLVRDFASSAGGASIVSFSGPDHTADGCGPGGLIDDSGDTVWGSEHGVQTITVDLGAQVDIRSVAIDPSAGCGDDQTAALGGYQVLTAPSPGAFASLAGGAFTAADLHALNDLGAAPRQGVRYVQLRALAPQDPSGESGKDFLDVAELRVTRVPGSPVGPAVDTGAATGVGAKGVTLNGSVRPNGAPPAVTFELGTTTSYGRTVAASGSGGAVHATLSDLTPLTEYHYRVVATRDGRRSVGADRTFVTSQAGVVTPPAPQGFVTLKSRATLKATRAGRFSVQIGFASNAPAGFATVTVKRKGKTIARKSRIAVVAGQSRTVKLKLTTRGRKLIKPGSTKKVRVRITLPGSDPAARTLKLKRRR